MHARQALYQLRHLPSPKSYQWWLLGFLDLGDYPFPGEPGKHTSALPHLALEVGLLVFLTPRIDVTAKPLPRPCGGYTLHGASHTAKDTSESSTPTPQHRATSAVQLEAQGSTWQ